MLRFLSAGESHGQALVVTVDGMPAGLELDIDALNRQLRRRQGGYGRGRRMQIESDRAEILAGRAQGPHDGRAHRDAHPQPRLGQLAADDARREGRCPKAPPAPTAPPSRARGPATPIWPAR